MEQIKMHSEIKKELIKLTGITNIYLTRRANTAIKIALKVAKHLGKTKCFILDQGGWITYPQFAKKLGFKIEYIKTKRCKINLSDLESKLDSESVVLITSLSGYFYKQPMSEIYNICKSKDSLLINDCGGSVTDKSLLEGDLFVCSFGHWKPINNDDGGFIGSKNKHLLSELFIEEYEIKDGLKLLKKIKTSTSRVNKLNKISLELIKELNSSNLIALNDVKNNPDLNLVVIVPFINVEEQERIVRIAKDIPFEVCPRSIRVLEDAISIEVKKLD